MKIGIDARMIKYSGIGRVIENILKRIIVLRPEWIFYILGNTEELKKYPSFVLPNVKIISCSAPIYSIKEQFELLRKIPSGLDLFWSPHYNVPIFYTGKLLVTIHDVFHLANLQSVQGIAKKIYAKLMFETAVSKAQQIICVSNFTARELCLYTHVHPDKLTVIPNGVDKSWMHIIKDRRRPVSGPYFIFVGNVKPHKNLRRLIRAYRLVASQLKEKLVIVGKKDGFITGIDNIKTEITGFEDRIIFTGYVDDDILQQYVAHAQAMIFPSLYEGFGLPPIEAMACGCAVAASDIPAVKEVCGDQVQYFDPYNIQSIAAALLKIDFHKDAECYVREKYSWNHTAQAVVEIMEGVF